MDHSFDIRFVRSAGLAAIFEAPDNSFEWTGKGSLSIDAQGISVAMRRGLLSALARNLTRRIRAADLKEVFREGEALRVEFATDDKARGSLRFWARDRDTAARIVQLLPTSRTLEFEESAAAGGYRIDRRIATVVSVALVMTTAAIVAISLARPAQPPSVEVAAFEPEPLPVPLLPPPADASATQPADESATHSRFPRLESAAGVPERTADASQFAPTSHETTPNAMAPIAASESENAPSAIEAGLVDTAPPPVSTIAERPLIGPPPLVPAGPASNDSGVTRIPGGTISWNRALRQLAMFGSESDDLLAAFDADLELFRQDRIRLADFTLRMSNLEKRWWNVTRRIQEAEDFADPLLVDLRATLLECAKERRDFLTSFSRGTSTRDEKAIKTALDSQTRAVELDRRARRFVD